MWQPDRTREVYPMWLVWLVAVAEATPSVYVPYDFRSAPARPNPLPSSPVLNSKPSAGLIQRLLFQTQDNPHHFSSLHLTLCILSGIFRVITAFLEIHCCPPPRHLRPACWSSQPRASQYVGAISATRLLQQPTIRYVGKVRRSTKKTHTS